MNIRPVLYLLLACWSMTIPLHAGTARTIEVKDFTEAPGEIAKTGLLLEGQSLLCLADFSGPGPFTALVSIRQTEAGKTSPLIMKINDAPVFHQAIQATNWHTVTIPLPARKERIQMEWSLPPGASPVAFGSLRILGAGPELKVISSKAFKEELQAERKSALAKSEERIALVRQGQVTVRVTGAAGAPASGVSVQVEQLRNEFTFGGVLCDEAFPRGKPPNSNYLNQFSRRFNAASVRDGSAWTQKEKEQNKTLQPMLNWCKANGIKVLGGPLLSDCSSDIPESIAKAPLPEQQSAVQQRLVSLNEWSNAPGSCIVIDHPGACSFFAPAFGPGRYSDWLKTVRNSAPDTILLVNSTDVLNGKQLDAYDKAIAQMIQNGNGPDSISIQARLSGHVRPGRILEALDRLAAFNLPLVISGFTCLDPDPQVRREMTELVYRLCYAHPVVSAIYADNLWAGCSDNPDAALLQSDFSQSPAALFLDTLLFEEWMSREEGTTDSKGIFMCNAFFGDYLVTVRRNGAEPVTGSFTLTREKGELVIDVSLASDAALVDNLNAPVGR